jgi:hypothetical protein
MRNILNLFLVIIFLFSGVSGLPACYATRLDCEKKNTNGCPFSSDMMEAETEDVPPCHFLLQKSNELPTEASFPIDRYKRLKIEQILHSPTELPPFIPSFCIPLTLAANDEIPVQNQITGDNRNPHYHPPPLFIQHQSFLI